MSESEADAGLEEPYILLPNWAVRPEKEPMSVAAPPAAGCSVRALRASVLRYLRRFLVSTFCPPRVTTDDLPS